MRSDFTITPEIQHEVKADPGRKWNPDKPRARTMKRGAFCRKWVSPANDFPMKHGVYFPPLLGRTYCLI